MFLIADRQLVLSATDLSRAAECEFAVARTLDAALGRIPAPPREADALLDRVAELGNAHEGTVLAAYRERFGRWDGSGGGVAELDRAQRSRDPQERLADLVRAAETTTELLRRDPDVLYQACFFDGSFLGYADFIVRSTDDAGRVSWLVQDTKLARRAKVQALIQLGAYADQLLTAGVSPSPRVELILGSGLRTSHRTDELVAVYRERMARLRGLLTARLEASGPLAWGSQDQARACLRCEVCAPFVEDTNDVILVAGLTVHQRDCLAAAGIATVTDLAGSDGPVDGIGASTLAGLRRQALLQVRQEGGEGAVLAEVIDPDPILALPKPSAGDIFFDFEGDPLWYDEDAVDPRDAWGLEYLFGVVEVPVGDAEPQFRPFWAHDRAEEKAALIAFVDYVEKRRETHPNLHVYHYAPYERSALLRLAGRYGVGEAVIDDWLRHGVLVDLYATVRGSIRTGQRSYSLKKLEPLFMASREDDVTTAGDSIVAYAQAVAARDSGDRAGWRQRIQDIADYNETDCVATLKLRDWLLSQVRGATTDLPTGASAAVDAGDSGVMDDLAAELMDRAGEPPRDRDHQAIAMMSAAAGYHWREAKPHWWAHFDRLAADPSEWMDRRSSLAADEVSVIEDWHLPGRARNWRRRVRMIGRLEPGSELRTGAKVVSIYDPVLPDRAKGSATGHRGWVVGTTVHSTGPWGERDEVVIDEVGPPKADTPYAQLPMGLGPDSPVDTRKIETAILDAGRALLATAPTDPLPRGPALDLLRREPPATRSGRALPAPAAGRPAHETITAALLDLDHSYLAVQGPPGTGKTYNGVRVVKALVERGWRIAVVAQSHAVVENFLREAIDAELPSGLIAKSVRSGGDQNSQPWEALGAAWLSSRTGGYLTGGTAWTYSNDTNIPEGGYDLIVIDEAGQFALANTIAVAGAAQRMLLLGDPQQLPQVSQGTHPEPVDASALGWLSAGHDTLPQEYGYFLDTSYRMHPAVCEVVSRMSYDNQLHSAPPTSQRSLAGVAPGVSGVPVEHHGHSVLAPEEVAEVMAQLHELVGRRWDDGKHPARPLTAADVLIVAPYNAQVRAIRAALDTSPFGEARVGTVDKFQGQQAPVVLVSLAASSADAAPRGMDFLLNRNRLNVALSRAQWCALVIHSPAIADYLPTRPEQLSELGAFLQLLDPTEPPAKEMPVTG